MLTHKPMDKGHKDPFTVGSVVISGVQVASKDSWVETSAKLDEITYKQSHGYMGTFVSQRMHSMALGLLALIFTGLLGRVMWLQTAQGSHFAAVSEYNRTRLISVSAERGLMYDRHGTPLVKNIPRFALHILPGLIPREDQDREKIVNDIAHTLEVDPDPLRNTLLELMGSYEREVSLFDRLTRQQAIALSVQHKGETPYRIVTGVQRSYNTFDEVPKSLAHIIGYEGKISQKDIEQNPDTYSLTDYIGKQGLEAMYENDLRGIKGKQLIEVSSSGTQLAVLSEVLPDQGHELTLSLDVELQKFTEEVLVSHLSEREAKRGVVIVQGVNNGEILALVSLPSFSHEKFAQGLSQAEFEEIIHNEDRPLINRAIAGLYPSGSTIKPIVGVAALHEGIIEPRTQFLSNGGVQVGPWFFPDWKAGGHGLTNIHKAIAESVNTFFYIIGGGDGESDALGVDRLFRWYREFGLGAKTGIDIPGEVAGLVPNPDWKELRKGEQWYIGDTYNLSIGQGDLLVTPLQVSNAIATIANGGTLYTPHMVKKIGADLYQDKNKRTLEITEEHFDEIKKGMRQAVTDGSARFLNSLPLKVAGKTGTAQWHSQKDHHAWFVGFAPYEFPEIAVTVLVEEGEEGSRVAVPIAHEIFAWWAKHRYPLNE